MNYRIIFRKGFFHQYWVGHIHVEVLHLVMGNFCFNRFVSDFINNNDFFAFGN